MFFVLEVVKYKIIKNPEYKKLEIIAFIKKPILVLEKLINSFQYINPTMLRKFKIKKSLHDEFSKVIY